METPAQVPTTTKDKSGFAIASLVLGIISMCAWLLPICGLPLSIVGLILGILGLKSSQRTLAIIGIVLSSLGLVAGLGNAALGAYLGLTNYLNQTQILSR